MVDLGPESKYDVRHLEPAKSSAWRIYMRLIRPGMTVFFDAGTTIYAIAEALAAAPVSRVTAVTNGLPVAEVLAEVKGLAV